MSYMNSEMCDMHLVYDFATGKNPDNVIPHHRMLARLHHCLIRTGEECPTTSTGMTAANQNIKQSIVFRILKNQLLHLYHIQRVQVPNRWLEDRNTEGL